MQNIYSHQIIIGKTSDAMREAPKGGTFTAFIAAPSGESKSLLSKLSPEQFKTLNEWSNAQPRRDGCINLMAWPGWAEALQQNLISKP